jgi:hypothetical protein
VAGLDDCFEEWNLVCTRETVHAVRNTSWLIPGTFYEPPRTLRDLGTAAAATARTARGCRIDSVRRLALFDHRTVYD